MTPALRSMRARIAAYAMHAKNDPLDTTAKARQTFRESFYLKTDPTQSESERRRRADMLYRQHMASVAYKGAKARTNSTSAATASRNTKKARLAG